METIQLTSNLEDKLDEFIIIMGGIETHLKEINKNLETINNTLESIGQDSEQLAYLTQFIKI